MKAEILCVGTELLLGDVLNTNTSYIAKELANIGIDVYHQGVIGDNAERLHDELDLCFSRSDLLIITGGLGPTYDDLTKETVADYFGLKLKMHEPSLKKIEAFFESINHVMTDNNKKQAMMPEGCVVFENFNGTAPGLAVSDKDKTVVMLPGPPREMEPMFKEQVIPYLMHFTDSVLVSTNIHVMGLGESRVESMLKDYMLAHDNPTIAPYAKTGEMYLRVTAKARSEAEARELLAPVVEEIKNRLGKYVYGVDVPDIQTAVYLKLKDMGYTFSTAESCTGGLISKKMTDIAGVSEVFLGGVCTYANNAKENILGVKSDTLKKYGAVSEQIAKEMAEGSRRIYGSDIAVSTTGIAGPGGGSKDKPVGLVYVGVSTGEKTEAFRLMLKRNYKDPRNYIRESAAINALLIVLKILSGITD